MVYARFASGYRPGGPNAAQPGVPRAFSPDKTENYEFGFKGDFLDRVLSVDASAYYIAWKNIQLQLFTPQNFGYSSNGSGAKSQGVEVSIEPRPVRGLRVGAWAAFSDAVLTEDFPAHSQSYGVTGNRLHFSSRFSSNVSVDEEFSLWGSLSGFFGGAFSYIGDRQSIFSNSPARQDLPGYAKFDLQLGAKYESWTANLFVNNLTDRRGLLNGGTGYLPPFAYVYIVPRTVGLNVVRSF